MHSDAGASAKVRQEHEEGRMDGVQVSFTAVCCVLLHFALTLLSFGMGSLGSLDLWAWARTISPGPSWTSHCLS
jgi:hypothetical protein